MNTYAHITGHPEDEQGLAQVEQLGLSMLEQEMEAIVGVASVTASLHFHHQLYVLTKGNEEELAAQIARSGLAHYFADAIITREKSVDTYHQVIERLGLDRGRTWMIGSSPRSVIAATAKSVNGHRFAGRCDAC